MQHPVVFFDGVCNLCSAAVQFIIAKDHKKIFRFAALQSDAASALLAPEGIHPGTLHSIILLDQGKVYQQSAAVLRICRKLGGGWSLLYSLIIVPAFIRDAVYRLIARHRYRIWGRQEHCMVPAKELNSRFLS